MMINKLEGGKG